MQGGWLTDIVRGVPRLFAAVLARKIEGRSRQWLDHAVWFRGARADITKLSDQGCILDPDLELQQALERVEAHVLKTRKLALEIVDHLERSDGSRTGLLRDAWRGLALAATDLYEAVSAFKWEMLEFDADQANLIQHADVRDADDIRRLLERV